MSGIPTRSQITKSCKEIDERLHVFLRPAAHRWPGREPARLVQNKALIFALADCWPSLILGRDEPPRTGDVIPTISLDGVRR